MKPLVLNLVLWLYASMIGERQMGNRIYLFSEDNHTETIKIESWADQ
ncbi:hypothetical protein [Alteribacter aurantiacus]|nr:hypothetical protein [Alteribacter aurantiacus]